MKKDEPSAGMARNPSVQKIFSRREDFHPLHCGFEKMEPLDIESPRMLVEYLQSTARIGKDELVKVTILAGGVSNKTVLVEREGGEAWVLKQALPKLRVVVDWFSDPARVRQEALALRHLPSLAPAGAITPLVFEDEANQLLAMEAVRRPHENWKNMLLSGRVEMEHVEQFAEILAGIHRKSAERAGEMARVFEERRFFESLRIEPYYQYTAGRVAEAAGFLNELVSRTRGRRFCVVHGDYSPKNVLVHEGRLILLDHEVIHWGDPAFDLGFGLTHLLSKARHLSAHRAVFVEGAKVFWRTYRREIGRAAFAEGLEAEAVRHTLGCLLARVAGRSTLEYLSPVEKESQRQVVAGLMKSVPSTIQELADVIANQGCPPL